MDFRIDYDSIVALAIAAIALLAIDYTGNYCFDFEMSSDCIDFSNFRKGPDNTADYYSAYMTNKDFALCLAESYFENSHTPSLQLHLRGHYKLN